MKQGSRPQSLAGSIEQAAIPGLSWDVDDSQTRSQTRRWVSNKGLDWGLEHKESRTQQGSLEHKGSRLESGTNSQSAGTRVKPGSRIQCTGNQEQISRT